MEKIISFIIPSYNVERYLETALNSMLHESCLEETEIIVIDDGSKDRTAEIAECYVKRYPDSVTLISKANGGHGSAINAGSRAASGKYFKVIDADDWIVIENLPDFINQLRKCNADVVLTPFHQVNMMDGTKSDWRMYCNTYEKEYTLEEVVADWKSFDRCMTFHGITYKTEFYNRYRYELPEKVFYEDQEYATIPCCHAKSIYPINLYVYQYLVGNSEQSVSAQNRLKRLSHVELVTQDMLEYSNHHPELEEAGRDYLFRKTEGVILSHYVVTCILQENKRLGRENAVRYNQMVWRLEPEMYKRIEKKFKMYRLMNRLHLSFALYELILHSRLYSIVRKSHQIEKG